MTQRPTPSRARWSDHEVDQVIGRLLQVGVLLAAAVLVVGAALFLVAHGRSPADFRLFRGEPESLRRLAGIAAGVTRLDPASVIELGFVLLIATPVARVALTLVAFVVQRDRVYVVLSALVLAILLYGLLVGQA